MDGSGENALPRLNTKPTKIEVLRESRSRGCAKAHDHKTKHQRNTHAYHRVADTSRPFTDKMAPRYEIETPLSIARFHFRPRKPWRRALNRNQRRPDPIFASESTLHILVQEAFAQRIGIAVARPQTERTSAASPHYNSPDLLSSRQFADVAKRAWPQHRSLQAVHRGELGRPAILGGATARDHVRERP